MSEFRLRGVEEVEREIERAQKYLAGIPRGAERAMMHAFNRAASAGKKAGAKAVSARYTIPPKRVKKAFRTIRANTKNLEATLESRDRRLALHTFRHNPRTDTTGGRRRQVRVAVKRGSAKPIGQGFIHEGKIFQRVGKSSYPIQFLHGVAIPVMLNNPDVVDAVQDKMMETAVKRLDHEVTRMLAGYEGEKKW